MTLIVDPWHWLTPGGEIPDGEPGLRRNVLKVARVIEYGADLSRNEGRGTLIECAKRPRGKACKGLLWVIRDEDDSLVALCSSCRTQNMVVLNWKETQWAEGQAVPVRITGTS